MHQPAHANINAQTAFTITKLQAYINALAKHCKRTFRTAGIVKKNKIYFLHGIHFSGLPDCPMIRTFFWSPQCTKVCRQLYIIFKCNQFSTRSFVGQDVFLYLIIYSKRDLSIHHKNQCWGSHGTIKCWHARQPSAVVASHTMTVSLKARHVPH